MKNNTGAIILRYALFYLAVVFFFSLYSCLLDLLFIKYEYGSIRHYSYGLAFWYAIYFIIGGFFVAIPICVGYNYVVSSIHFKRSYLRIIIGLVVGILIGSLMQTEGYSIYFGHMKPLKSIILFGLVGISIEITRLIKERIVQKRKQRNI